MHSRINQGRTYGGGSVPTGPRRHGGDSYRPVYSQGQSTLASDNNTRARNDSSGSGFLSRSDMASRAIDGGNTSTASTSAQAPASRLSTSIPSRPTVSQDPQHQNVNNGVPAGPPEEATSAPANNVDRRPAGQVRGILKTAQEPARSTAPELNASLNKSNGGKSTTESAAAAAAAANPLLGQFTFVGGLREPIKTLQKTLADLRARKPASEAFQSKEASHLYKKDANGHINDVKDIPHLSAYFPLSERKEQPHNPSECGKLCNGAPHVDRGPVCRFCLTRIAQKYKDELAFNARVARECLLHLQTCPGIPKEEDRRLLFNAFRKADERFIQDYHTTQWKTNISLQPEVQHARPTMPPKPRPPPQASSMPMQRKTSGSYAAPPSAPAAAPPPPQFRSEARQQAYVPIAAKQLPNVPTEPAAMRRGSSNNTSLNDSSTSSYRPTASTSTLPPAEEEAGWGVSKRSSAYHEHVAPATPSEKDELEELHDPEDNFTWQTVRELLKTAPTTDNAAPATSNGQPSNADTAMFFGAEFIQPSQSAPQGPGYVPSPFRQFSVPPPRHVSRNPYMDMNGSTSAPPDRPEDAPSPVSNSTTTTQLEDVDDLGCASMSMDSSMSSTSSGQPRQITDNLFRPGTPPSSRNAKQEVPTPPFGASRGREPSAETQDIPEPELPAEDPWDLIPEPGFEPFFGPSRNNDFLRSGAPSLESRSRVTSKNTSASPQPESGSVKNAIGSGSDTPKRSGNKTPRRETSFVVEIPTPRREHSTTPQPTVHVETVQVQEKTKKKKKTPAEKEAKKIRKAEKQQKKEDKRKAQEAEEAAKTARERSPSVECLNPLRPDPSTSSSVTGRGTESKNDGTNNEDTHVPSPKDSLFSAADDEDDDDDADVPLRAVPSSHARPVPEVEVLEISSDEDEASKNSASSSRPKAKPPLGPVAQKTFKKKKDVSSDQSSDDGSSSSDSDGPKVTSKRVEVYIPRAHPAGPPKPTAKKQGRPSVASSKPSTQQAPQKRARLPSPSDTSGSDSASEEESRPLTASQVAAAARRFQRFGERDHSPDRRARHTKKKRKPNQAKPFDRHSTPSRIIRRNVDVHEDSPATADSRKRKVKVVETSDEEENGVERPSSRRLKTWAERQAELTSRSEGSTSRRSSSNASEAVDPSTYFDHKPDLFFVDVQKNIDNVLSMPKELEPWQDIFQAAEILNLDTLRDCIGSADNADEFVKWVVERTGRQVSLAKQFPMVQALRHVLSQE
ncbi:hypothetical protein P389DRAFT_46870 [Cystobasidium minutum MCA 4210]|uniref:uncharacterized protein n=1 Tax=Cystobasidium minutum MCA 4210 TaxID=1397322 RepID=UPI0034CF7030|eukprot:jgi/Rhomi1/46870/CE46869_919